MRRAGFVPTLVNLLGLLLTQKALAWSMETIGNKPMSELNYTSWKGIMPLVNDKHRVFATWTNGNEHLYYKGTTRDLNAALVHFAKMEVKNRVVVLSPGPGVRAAFDKTPIAYNWELHVLGGLARSRANDNIDDLYWQKDPVLTVCVGADIDLDKMDIPAGVTLRAAPGRSEEARKNSAVAQKIAEYLDQKKK